MAVEHFDDLILDAAEVGNLTEVRRLIEAHPELVPEVIQESLVTWVAARLGDSEMVQYLLDVGASVNGIQDDDDDDNARWTPLWGAASEGHESVVELLLANGADVEMTDKDGWTVLHNAAWGAHDDVVKVLLSHSQAIIDRLAPENRTALLLACACGHVMVARMLLRAGADPTIVDSAGHTPMQRALDISGGMSTFWMQKKACTLLLEVRHASRAS